MIFTTDQIQEILEIISYNTILFIGTEVGFDILSTEDKELLKKFGIKVDELELPKYTPFERAFYFGRLSLALGDKYTKNLQYEDFLQYLRRGQYKPLTPAEKKVLQVAKQSTYGYIKGLGDTVKREAFQTILKNSLVEQVSTNKSIQNTIGELSKKLGSWEKDLGRIVATETQNLFEKGRAEAIKEEHGDDALVYKEVFPLACRYCIKLYLTNGVGSQPRIFKISELEANGSNVGRKAEEWKATVGPTHPWCRCILRYIPKGYIWSPQLQMFVPPDINPNKPKKGITITVGDKVIKI